ncbi:Hypothetical predicted protein [Pelobates cultripes]|uniref:Uncharacterized protein n=1 Tax=Pelobates cultripes TaxID=61616 RepID=A0AAD1W9X1_PELCU|nr:Hypothetical predicted protein [Pelobates cultripes]
MATSIRQNLCLILGQDGKQTNEYLTNGSTRPGSALGYWKQKPEEAPEAHLTQSLEREEGDMGPTAKAVMPTPQHATPQQLHRTALWLAPHLHAQVAPLERVPTQSCRLRAPNGPRSHVKVCIGARAE